jgi:DNA-binding beta-propeller fold protein YncE
MILGQGDFRYELVEGWPQMPEGFTLGDGSSGIPAGAAGVSVDSKDRVFIFCRGNHPVLIFDRSGRFISCWGEGQFPGAHGIYIGSDDAVYLTDYQTHTVTRHRPNGELEWMLGRRYVAMPPLVGKPFCMPTKLVVGPTGEMFASDGYANFFIHKFSSDRKWIKTWGGPGHEPGQLQWPHSLDVDRYGTVYVCDRENDRIQVFDSNGALLKVWSDFMNPQSLFVDRKNNLLYIIESQVQAVARPQDRSRVSICDLKGKMISMFEGRKSEGKGELETCHDICVDSHGDIYIGEVNDYPRVLKFARIK